MCWPYPVPNPPLLRGPLFYTGLLSLGSICIPGSYLLILDIAIIFVSAGEGPVLIQISFRDRGCESFWDF